jgi:dihydrofolate reductase
MARLRVNCFTISADGYGAGRQQSLDNPLGVGGEELHDWLVGTRTFHELVGKPGGETGLSDDFTARGFENVGAWILGRNMFGPIRGQWTGDWRGWWGDEPPYHVPVFVLTHHARQPVEMQGGTTFHFVTGGIHAALDAAMQAAGGKDVRLGGGVSTIRQYLTARLVDEMHVAISPVLLGGGEHLLAGLDLPALGFALTEHVGDRKATHLVVTKQR